MRTIQKAAVVGAGVMGSGIAAHFANAGLEVVLLDMSRELAEAGVSRQLKANGFMDPAFAGRIRTGSIADDLGLLPDADWIVEAVAEKLEIKQSIYRAIDGIRRPGSIVSSNTSTIPLHELTEGMPAAFAADFLIAHFFNPPRIMRLLEVVVGRATLPAVAATIRDFADRSLGKSVVDCKDTPGFIANRIGSYWMMVAQNEAIAMGIDVEEADAVIGKPFGIPSTGIFGLLDLIGIDLMPTILRRLQNATPHDDPIHDESAEPALIARMIREGRLGRKSGAGFVRIAGDRRAREVVDLKTGDYRPQRAVNSPSLLESGGDPKRLMEHPGAGGRYAATVMEKTLSYAASLFPEIANMPAEVDEAMRTGYGWKEGPFELVDRLGADWLVKRLSARGLVPPPFLADAAAKGGFYSVVAGQRTNLLPNGSSVPLPGAADVLLLSNLARAGMPTADWGVARLWDLGDGVAGLELLTKMNTFDPTLIATLHKVVERCRTDFRALVIGSDAPLFSAGADLRFFLGEVERNGPAAFNAIIGDGQAAFAALKYAPFPVVGAAAGSALGGGCEILLHCDAIQAHAELTIGLVEPRIGVIPGWGGCKEMLLRFSAPSAPLHGPVAPAIAAFNLIAQAKTSTSAFDARRLGFLRDTDGITMNRDRLLGDAKARALALAADYVAPPPPVISLAGPSGAALIEANIAGEALAGRATPHDSVVGRVLARVLTGANADPHRPLAEADVLALERDAFVELLGYPATIERIRHMLATGKPLRN